MIGNREVLMESAVYADVIMIGAYARRSRIIVMTNIMAGCCGLGVAERMGGRYTFAFDGFGESLYLLML